LKISSNLVFFRFLLVQFFTINALLFFSTGCFLSYQNVEFKRAQSKESEGKFEEAIEHYIRTIKRDERSDLAVEAARKASRIALLEIKKFSLAIQFYKHLIMYSKDEKERVESQKKIADIYFEKIGDYSQVIIEYGKLLKLNHSPEEDYFYRTRIAKSHFQINNFYQSLVEIDSLLESIHDNDKKFELKVFKATVLLTTKKIDEAIELFKDLLKENPERANSENIGLNLSVAYEEKNDFEKAIEVLEQVKEAYPTKEFIELKIKRLKERAKNQPGASGLKR